MAGVEKKKKSIFKQEHFWIGVAAGAGVMFAILQPKLKRGQKL